MRSIFTVALALAIAGCNGPAIPEAYLILGWPSLDFRVPQGGEGSVTVVVDRTPDYNRNIRVTARNLPSGVTSSVTATTVDGTTTSIVTLKVAGNVALGKYFFVLVVSGEGVLDANRQMIMNVVEPPAYSMTVARPTLNVARGGAAPLLVSFTRTNFTTPVHLSVSGVAGVTATFPANPAPGDQANGLLSISGSASPGAHTLTLRGAAAPLDDRTVQVSLTISEDHLQVFTDSVVSARQGATTVEPIVVNKSDVAGSVTLSAEGLPAGVTASFAPEGAFGYTMSLAVLPSVPVGSHAVTVRAAGSGGVTDATAVFTLTIVPSTVAIVIAPDTLSVFQGSSDGAALTLQRTSLDGAVAIALESVPAGLTITANPTSITGNTGTVNVAAAASLTPGVYAATVVATPSGWGPGDAKKKVMLVNVREVPVGGGNVILDWGRCTVPSWVAGQDDNGAWTRLLPVSGVFRFTVNGARGGVAYRDPGDTTVIRLMTKAELTAMPLDMCSPTNLKTITGTGVPSGPNEVVAHNFGGARAMSTVTSPNFTLAGVRPGIHDLVSFASLTATGQRILILRDLDVPDGEGVGPVETSGSESFLPSSANVFTAGAVSGESVSHTMNVLTTSECTVNQLYSTTPLTTTSTTPGLPMYGVPDSYRRPSDYHMVTVSSQSATRIRTATAVFQRLEQRTIPLNTQSASVGVNSISGGHKRFQVFVSNFSAAYNRSATLRYSGNGKSVQVYATMGYLKPTPATFIALATPDLSGAAGWQSSFAPATSDVGSWNLLIEGAAAGPVCATNYSSVSLRHFGSF